MIFIDKEQKYDIILTYSPIPEITGHVFECFDYWLVLRQRYRVGILFLAGLSLEQLETVWNSKYTIPFDDVKPFIMMVDDASYTGPHIYKFNEQTIVFLCDGNIRALNDRKIIFASGHMLGFLCGDHHFEQCKMNTNITYLQDYRIYGKNRYFKSYDYVKKLPFRFYRKCDRKPDNTGMMYVTYACRKVTPYVIKDYHERSGCRKSLLVVPYKLDEYDGIEDVEQVVAPVPDFFNTFDTYIYTPVERHFDCSPRLVTECFMQKKDILIDLPYVDIGLQTRYNDCRQNLQSLDLTDKDPVFQIIEEMRHENRA